MGLIRKTLSISTLGLVNWRSKKELLAEAEAELETTRADLERTSKVESLLREKLDHAELRATEAELTALRDARRAGRRGARTERAKFPRRKQLAAAATSAIRPVLASARDAAERIATDAEPLVDETAARGRRARKKLEKRARKAEKRARTGAARMEAKARAGAEQVRQDVAETTHDLRHRAEDAAESMTDRARELTSG